jgi:hypothetical protein
LLFRTQNDLQAAHEKIKIQQNELSHLHQQLFAKDESKKNGDLIIDQYQQQITNEKELRLSKNKNHQIKLNLHFFPYRN